MPRSELLGRARTSTTVYHYNGEGRLARAVTTHDPRFTGDDTEAALDRAETVRLTCGGCGLPADETVPVDADHAAEIDARLQVDTFTCGGCARLYRAGESGGQLGPGQRRIVTFRD